MEYNLEERTAVFDEKIITLVRKLPNDSVNKRLIAQANPEFITECRDNWKEAQELLLIFSKIITSCRNKNQI